MKKKKATSRAAKRTTMTLLCVMLGLVLVLMLGATVYVEYLLNQMNYLGADETQPYLSQDEADQLAMQETEAQDPNFTGPQLRDEDVEFADTDDIKIGGGKDVVNILLMQPQLHNHLLHNIYNLIIMQPKLISPYNPPHPTVYYRPRLLLNRHKLS